jgi:gluconate 5-dehydrogenase
MDRSRNEIVTDLFDLSGMRILVTGSTRGLGRTFAEGFAAAGATVVINGRAQGDVDRVVKEFGAAGRTAHGWAFDISDGNEVEKAIGQIEDTVGPIEVLVNNAGIQRRVSLSEMSEEDWQMVIDVNLTSAFRVSKRVSRKMIERGEGSIINISSLNSLAARPTIANYCAAKAGLNALTRSMATEWGRSGIRANAIAPGYFLTDLTRPLADDPKFDSWVKSEIPLERWGDPEELLGAAIFLASKASTYVNGHVMVVDGGWTACL